MVTQQEHTDKGRQHRLAKALLEAANGDYRRQCDAARAVAESAFASDSDLELLIRDGLRARTEHTVVAPSAFRADASVRVPTCRGSSAFIDCPCVPAAYLRLSMFGPSVHADT